VSLAGTWMQQIAMIWLAWRLSNSAAVLGLVGFASQIPILVLGPFAGVLTDRFDRRRILLATQFAAMLQAVALTLLTWLGQVSPAWLIGLALVLGTINALDLPARQAFSAQLVDKREDLPNAIALNSLLMNSARFVGPALAGFAVATIGEAWCFAINAASYLAVILALLAIRVAAHRAAPVSAWQAFRAGIAYVWRHPQIRPRLLTVAAVSFLVTPYAVMMPLFASEIYGADARAYGLLIGSAGAGALGAGLYLASRQGTERLPRRVADAVLLASGALVLFSLNTLLAARLCHRHGDGFRRDRLHRRQQYAGADASGRCPSRPRDGYFLDGLPRHRAARQLYRRPPGAMGRRAAGAVRLRACQPGGGHRRPASADGRRNNREPRMSSLKTPARVAWGLLRPYRGRVVVAVDCAGGGRAGHARRRPGPARGDRQGLFGRRSGLAGPRADDDVRHHCAACGGDLHPLLQRLLARRARYRRPAAQSLRPPAEPATLVLRGRPHRRGDLAPDLGHHADRERSRFQPLDRAAQPADPDRRPGHAVHHQPQADPAGAGRRAAGGDAHRAVRPSRAPLRAHQPGSRRRPWQPHRRDHPRDPHRPGLRPRGRRPP
jgi:MFS family permease